MVDEGDRSGGTFDDWGVGVDRGEGQLVVLQGEQVELGVPSVPSHRTLEEAASNGKIHGSESSTIVKPFVHHATVCCPTEYKECYSEYH